MAKKFSFFALFLSVMLFFTGCFQPKTPEQIIAESSYPSLTKYFLEAKLPSSGSMYANRIIYKDYMSGKFGSVEPSIQACIGTYLSRYDSSNDYAAKAFIAHAKSQNHTVKMYKSSVNSAMAAYLPMTWDIANNPSASNIDNAFVEFDENGRIVAVLVRVHYFYESIGVGDNLISFVAFGNLARQIENNVGNRVFENGFITEIK